MERQYMYLCAVSGVFYILLFYLLGSLISSVTGGLIPGNIIGMVMLFVALRFNAVRPRTVEPASRFLLDNMAMLFVPPGVGLLVSYSLIERHLCAVIVAGTLSTVIVIVLVGWIQQFLGRKL